MDNNKKLTEELLKADGIKPRQISEAERKTFAKMLDRQLKSSSILKRALRHKITKFAVAAVIIISAMVGVHHLGGSFDGATVAFANSVGPFLEARTATFTINVESEDAETMFPMNMKGMYAEPSRMRYDSAGGVETTQIFDLQKGKFVTFMPMAKTAYIVEMASMPVEKQHQTYMFFDIRNQLRDIQASKKGDVKLLGQAQVDGISAVGYLLKDELGTRTTFWLDTETMLPIRIEYDMSEIFNKQMTMVMGNFEFNVELDESLFSLDVPEDYKIQTFDMDASNLIEEDLIEMFRLWAEKTGGRFPSAIGMNVKVLTEFTSALVSEDDMFKPIDRQLDENNVLSHEFISEIKRDVIRLHEAIQNRQSNEDLESLAGDVKSHLQQLQHLKAQKEQAQQQYYDRLTSRSEKLSNDPFGLANNLAEKIKPVTRGMAFVISLPDDSDWHYAGKDVEYGDGNTPIFWYRPQGLGICRIIYGDLSIVDVDFSQQPTESEVLPEHVENNAAKSEVEPAITTIRQRRQLAEEKALIKLFEIHTTLFDSKFPDSLGLVDIVSEFAVYRRKWLHIDGRLPSDSLIVPIRKDMLEVLNKIDDHFTDGTMFVFGLKPENDWHYAGKGFTLDSSYGPVFWYKPDGSENYRVIYSDMTVREMTADELPRDNSDTQGYQHIHKERKPSNDPVEIEKPKPSDPAAVEILNNVQLAYSAMKTYRSDCEVIADYDVKLIFDEDSFPNISADEINQLQQNEKFKRVFNRSNITRSSVKINLTLPQRYYIHWFTEYIKGSGAKKTGSVWSDDNGYYGTRNGKEQTYDHFYPYAGPWGSSKTVPMIFYNGPGNTSLKWLTELSIEADEIVQGQMCHVVSGLMLKRQVKLWISKDQNLIIKKQTTYNYRGETINHESYNKRILTSLGRDITPENLENLKLTRDDGFAKYTNQKGKIIETHKNITINEPISDDQLQPPPSNPSE